MNLQDKRLRILVIGVVIILGIVAFRVISNIMARNEQAKKSNQGRTAVIMAAYRPEYLWLATCGSNGLKADRLECLRGRRFTLFPDSGCFDKWSKVMQQTTGLQYNIDNKIEQYPANTDLADLLLRPP